MKLLLRRTQSTGPTGRVRFKLWGKIELENDELQILRKYSLDKAILVFIDQPGLLRNTIVSYIAIASIIFAFSLPRVGAEDALLYSLIGALVPSWFLYDYFRETVYVKDLMHGRYFSCPSVVELARKEAWLQHVTSFLRQVMQTVKYWDGEEPVDIPALDNELAKQIIIKGL